MTTEVLPVSIEDKGQAIVYIRDVSIPRLVQKDYPSEQVLRILHRLGTWRALPGTAELNIQAKKQVLFFAGVEPAPTNLLDLERELAELSVRGPDRYTSYGYFYKGDYRNLGCFSPNPRIAQFAPEAASHFVAALPVSTKDYHQTDGTDYYPPVFNIHKLMATICGNFDNRFASAQTPEETAKLVADFYFWGLVMVHPFLGGNHRAYDRFIEYAFAKKGEQVYVPHNKTLNIPNDDPFNQELYRERRRLLEESSLLRENFNHLNRNTLNRMLSYQHSLNEMVTNCLNRDCAQTEDIARAILDWRS